MKIGKAASQIRHTIEKAFYISSILLIFVWGLVK